jgi:hypothetical protein
MKVGELTKVLEGIASGLSDVAKQASAGLAAWNAGLKPFAEHTVEQFVAFLAQCDEYNRTGVVTIGKKQGAPKMPKAPKAPKMTVQAAAAEVKSLLAEIDRGTVTGARVDTLVGDIQKALSAPQMNELLTALSISGKGKSKGQAADKVRQVLNNQLEMYVKNQALDGPRPQSVGHQPT